MLVACRLAGLSALESRLCGRTHGRATVGAGGQARDAEKLAFAWFRRPGWRAISADAASGIAEFRLQRRDVRGAALVKRAILAAAAS